MERSIVTVCRFSLTGSGNISTKENTTALELVLKRDRIVVASKIIAVLAIAWSYTISLAQSNASMSLSTGMAMGNMRSWSFVDFGLMSVMWVVMMVPSAAPLFLLFASVNRKWRKNSGPFVPTSAFVSGDVVSWSLFALGATLGNWDLH